MRNSLGRLAVAWLALAAVAGAGVLLLRPVAADPQDDQAALPPPVRRPVDFRRDVLPLLSARCAQCHTGKAARAEFHIDTRQTLLKGGESGEVVSPGHSDESYLIDLVAGREPDRVMPARGPRLSAEQIGVLRAWIDQGLKWEAGYDFAAARTAAIHPRRPSVPPPDAAGMANPIDRILASYYRQHAVGPAEPISDRVFARRVSLDLVGLLPSPERLEAFTRDKRPDKREALVKSLLDDREAYAVHWLTFWNDALRNAYRGTGYIDGGRRQITGWLFGALYENKPYDKFVRELVDPTPESAGFIGGIKWRGVVNASQRREMQAAQNVAQVFLGSNLKCASCHDSFVNEWNLTDSYGLAGVFADGPLEIHRCDKPTGKTARPAFIYPSLGTIDAAAPKPQRMKQLAGILTSPEDGRLARTIVNRLWAQLFGRGLVEPVDDMDAEPVSRDLLDFLGADLQGHGYDLKHTLALLCTSRAYQRPAVGAPRPDERAFVFRGPLVRRMSAEQFADAVSTVTGVWQQATGQMTRGGGGGPGGQLAAVRAAMRDGQGAEGPPQADLAAARWIWSHAGAAQSDPGGRIFLRGTFELDAKPDRATAAMTCDNEFTLYVNGRKVAAGDDWTRPVGVDLAPYLAAGNNTIAVEAVNWPDEETGRGLQFKGQPNPAGFVFVAVLAAKDRPPATIVSDASWIWRKGLEKDWQRPALDTKGWKHAAETKAASDVAAKLADALRPQSGGSQIRAALADADPLTRALGRPNREQVVTRRDSIATTLQGMELTNGPTLDGILRRGAERWVARDGADSEKLTAALFLAALGREPNAEERAAALEVLGPKPNREGVEDLLWIVCMLPEFQLIY